MKMPTPCPLCGEIVEFETMATIGRGYELYCEDCCEEMEDDSDE